MPSNSKQFEDFYVDNDRSVLTYMNDVYEQNSSMWLQFMYEGDIDTRFAAGDQEAIYNYIGTNYNYFKRNQINFNQIRSIRNMISGHQRRNRKTSVVVPQGMEDQETADQLSEMLLWAMNKSDAFNVISKSFEGALTAGMNLVSTYMDYQDDPANGDICINNIGYNSFLIDPFFKKLDLSDCNYIWTRKWLTKDQVKCLLPGRENDIDAMPTTGQRDGKFPYMPESLNYRAKNLLPYDEFWYMDTREEYRLVDMKTGNSTQWRGNDENLNVYLQIYPQLKKIKVTLPSVKLAIVINNRVFYNGKNPYNIHSFPFVPFVGYFDPDIPYFHSRIQGIVRDLRDAQWSYNRRMRLNLDYLEAGISRGVKFVEGALVDPQDAFLNGSGKGLPIKSGHSLDEVQEIPPPQLPPSWFQEIEKLQSDMTRISGVNEELMGAADDNKAGILSMLRQGAGLTTLQPLFDNLDYSQRILAKLYLNLIQNNFTPEKIQRIINKQPTQEITNLDFVKYDCQVIDGTLTANQQIMEFQQLWEMMQAGLPIPPDLLLKNAPLQNKKDLMEAIEMQQKQQSDMQEMQTQLQLEEIRARTNLAHARAYADEGLGSERLARIPENRALAVERVAAAKKDLESGTLDEVRAAKEIQGMNLDQLMQAINIVRALEEGKKTPNPELAEETNVQMQQM